MVENVKLSQGYILAVESEFPFQKHETVILDDAMNMTGCRWLRVRSANSVKCVAGDLVYSRYDAGALQKFYVDNGKSMWLIHESVVSGTIEGKHCEDIKSVGLSAEGELSQFNQFKASVSPLNQGRPLMSAPSRVNLQG